MFSHPTTSVLGNAKSKLASLNIPGLLPSAGAPHPPGVCVLNCPQSVVSVPSSVTVVTTFTLEQLSDHTPIYIDSSSPHSIVKFSGNSSITGAVVSGVNINIELHSSFWSQASVTL